MESYIEHGEREMSPRRQWCIVHDADTLEILHIQEYIAVTEVQPEGKQQLEAIALENAARYFPERPLAVLHPETTDLNPSLVTSIDPQSMTVQLDDGLLSESFPRQEQP